jgi:GT2 family glycosyltransferase
MKKIATILTVFNRREKTLSCLQHLYEALEAYNQSASDGVTLSVFLTDDGCTDGTADAIRSTFPDKDIHIVQGTGSLFWAGGMRLAWQTAIDSGTAWDYYLLLNDDTNIYNNVFEELFEADEYGYRQTGKHGLSSGITCQPGKQNEITYGGIKFLSKTKGRYQLAKQTGTPQSVDSTHANILLIHNEVVATIGIFYEGYRHGGADVDYAMTCNRHRFPVYITAHICGECEFDHDSDKGEIERLMEMTLAERKAYVNSPIHSDHDYLLRVRRNQPLRFPLTWLIRTIRLYLPGLYYKISSLRGLYK